MSARFATNAVIVAFAFAASVVTLYDQAVPGGLFALIPVYGVLWLVTCSVWIVQFAFPKLRPRPLAAVVAPALLVATLTLAQTDLPMRAGLEVSQGDLMRRIETGQAGRAGIYSVGRPLRGPGPVLLPVRHAGFLYSCGFFYAPAGVPSGGIDGWGESVEYRHVTGHWYWYAIDEM